jgi:hypothetical protein
VPTIKAMRGAFPIVVVAVADALCGISRRVSGFRKLFPANRIIVLVVLCYAMLCYTIL